MISKKSRKQLRKELRKQKKAKKNEYYCHRNKERFVLNPNRQNKAEGENVHLQKGSKKIKTNTKEDSDPINSTSKISSNETLAKTLLKEKREHKKLQKQMQKQRTKQLKRANLDEDRNIKQLEKQLKLNKRKSKSIPKSFANDGLDYLLEACDSDGLKGAATAEQQFLETDADFEEDFILMTGKSSKKNSHSEGNSSSDEDIENNINDSDEQENDNFFVKKLPKEKHKQSNGKNVGNSKTSIKQGRKHVGNEESEEEVTGEEFAEFASFTDEDDDLADLSAEENEEYQLKERENSTKRKNNENKSTLKAKKIKHEDSTLKDLNVDDDEEKIKQEGVEKDDGVWEDIYGRVRGKDGSIMQNNERKYIPPAVRAKLEAGTSTDVKHQEKLMRLKKQLKGLINRLAEANMHKIATEMEQLYMSNSRNDMNETLTNLIFEALISHVLTPERFVLEHVMLIATLHTNVGVEVGAHFLQTLVKKFNELYQREQSSENKMLENTVQILSHLYNFKVFDAKLLYQILEKLNNRFNETDVECVLLILKSVGFSLRKDDPIALKNLILNIQKQAVNSSKEANENPRVKFMLDILLAIKNNNVTKIPNYDTSYAEHLKKLLKNFVRKGLYVSTLNISLQDLLKADERGKWWVVGSAWTGKDASNTENTPQQSQPLFSQKLLDLARKQRMNTDTRRNIFCIIMSAEDYLDAFEKLLHLGLKNQQEREIIHVLLHCCLQEKDFNPYYAFLAQKFCEYDRRFQMTIKCSVWDKLKALSECSARHLSNLAKLLTHLFLENSLPLSTLKIMQFSELDKVTLRFVRQILLGILLYEDAERCQHVFEKVSQGEKLKMFRESLRLFIKHFLLRNLKGDAIPEHQRGLLEERANLIDKVLSMTDKKVRF